MSTFTVRTRSLGKFDVIVAGGGIAGAFAAITAARQGAAVLLVEGMGCLGGTLTHGLVPQVLDRADKGGLVQELYDFLDANALSGPRCGSVTDDRGRLRPGNIVSVEGAKTHLDTLCRETGVNIVFYSHVIDVIADDQHISRVIIGSECGAYEAEASLFIDATGNGTLALLAGCQGEIGHPQTHAPQPASMALEVTGVNRTTSVSGAEEKTAYGKLLADHGIAISGTQANIIRMPDLANWLLSVNFEYNVDPADIRSLTAATINGRRENLETAIKHRSLPDCENLYVTAGSEHLGIREGYRIFGKYRLTLDDILAGARFDDAVCLVHFNVDIHKLSCDDTVDTSRGLRIKPYHIPFRSLLPDNAPDNLLLCGRLISGDFFAHASYRVMGPMGATGEAAGFAAAYCASHRLPLSDFNATLIPAFMKSRNYGGL